MDLPLFTFLEGISPWWWVAAGIALGALEMATMSFFLLWPALGALVMAGLLALWPDISGATQIILFAVISIALTFLGRGLTTTIPEGGQPQSTLNSRAAQLIGRRAKVLELAPGGIATVEVDGLRWRADLGDAAAAIGTDVEVTGAAGMVLKVKPTAP